MRIAYLAMELPPALGRGPACPAPSSATTNTLPPDRQPGLDLLQDFSGAAAAVRGRERPRARRRRAGRLSRARKLRYQFRRVCDVTRGRASPPPAGALS